MSVSYRIGFEIFGCASRGTVIVIFVSIFMVLVLGRAKMDTQLVVVLVRTWLEWANCTMGGWLDGSFLLTCSCCDDDDGMVMNILSRTSSATSVVRNLISADYRSASLLASSSVYV